MACCHYYAPSEGGDTAFSVDTSSITFGPGCLVEAGDRARALGIKRIALMTDKGLMALAHVDLVERSLKEAGVDVAVYDEVRVEPTDGSFLVDYTSSGEFRSFIKEESPSFLPFKGDYMGSLKRMLCEGE